MMFPGAIAGEDGGAEDPWRGKSRADVEAMLGVPDKIKKGQEGETLVYKMLRFAEDAEPTPGMVLLELPGVGLVGRVPEFDDPRYRETTSIEPSGYDEQGRPVAGGVSTSSSYSKSIHIGKDDNPPDPTPNAPESVGKAKLVFHIAGDHVRDWSISSKGKKR